MRYLRTFRLPSRILAGPAPSDGERPLLLIDVDGVISLFGFDPTKPLPGQFVTVDGMPHCLSAQASEHLARLDRVFDCAWCSGWKDRTDQLPGFLELDIAWPYVPLSGRPGAAGEHWKLAAIDAFAGRRRPLAWIDDDLDERCDRWAAARPAPTLLVRTEPATGITREHVRRLLAFVDDVTG